MEKTVIDFGTPDEQARWEIINDTVMGGVSSSRISQAGKETALFQGFLSLENNGGFASMRSLPRKFELTGQKGLMLRVKGDGKNYRLRLRMDDAFEGIAYQARFSTESDRWIIARLSFDAFTPVFRGRSVNDAPEIDVRGIRRIGIMIADKQAGPFRLEIDWIKTFA